MATTDTSMWGLYVHKAKDGSLAVVDSAGKLIASPPSVKLAPDGSFVVVDSSGSAVLDQAKVPLTLSAYSPPTHNVYAYTAADGSVTIVDSVGNPVPTPPEMKKMPNGEVVAVDSSGQVVEDAHGPLEIPAYSSPVANVYYHTVAGSTIVVDASGKPIPSPPHVSGTGSVIDPATGKSISLPEYSPPIHNVYAYTEYDGTVTIVDSAGNPVPTPPAFLTDSSGKMVVASSSNQAVLDAAGQPVEIPEYTVRTSGVFYMASVGAEFGGVMVDAAGNPISSPPHTDYDSATETEILVDADGEPLLDANNQIIPMLRYSVPSTAQVYSRIDTDDSGHQTVTIMDAAGTPLPVQPLALIVSSPGVDPPVVQIGDSSGAPGQVWVSSADGDPIAFPIYQPATAPRLLVHLAPDGTPEVVDASGRPVANPPTVALHPASGEPAIVDANGQFVLDSAGNLTTLPVFSPPTQGIYAHVLTDPVTGEVDVQIVDAAGYQVSSPPGFKLVASGDPSAPPTVVLTDASGKPITDANGNQLSPPTYSPPTQGIYAHVVTHPVTGEVDVQIVDAAGNQVSSPPGFKLVASGDPSAPPTVVLTDASGKPITDANGNQLSPPTYSPPTQGIYAHVVTHPVTGEVDVQIVDAAGNQVSSPPGFKLVASGDPSAPPTVVLTDASGKPITDANGNQLSPPTYSPPTQGIYAHVVTHPVTGEVDVQIVDAAGNQVSSPPGFKLVASGDPSAPPTVVLTDASGKPITDANGNQLSPPTYSPPTQGIYAHVTTDPVTGEVDVQLVDAAGNLVPSPPGYTVQKGADPSDPPIVVLTGTDGKPLTDQDGNPISVPLDPSSSTPPGAPPSADDAPEDDSADTTPDGSTYAATASEDEGTRGERGVEEEVEPIPAEELVGTGEVTPAETAATSEDEGTRGERGVEEEVEPIPAEELVSAGEETPAETAAGAEAVVEVPDLDAADGPVEVPEVEGEVTRTPEPDAVELEAETSPTEMEAVAYGVEAIAGDEEEPEERSAEVESDTVRISTPDEVSATPITLPDIPEEVIPVDPLAEIGVIGVGTEELVDLVSGPVAEGGEVAAAEVEGSLAGGEPFVEIPDLLSPELDRKGDDRPVPGSDDVEFEVEVAPTEELAEVEPSIEVVGVDSVTGLGSDELGEVLAGRDVGVAAEEAGEGLGERVEAEGSGLGEEVPELRWGTEVGVDAEGSIAGEAVVPELEGKIVPDVEPEVVEFQVEVVPVVEAETLEIDEEAAGEPMRILEEPDDEAVGRYLTEEEPDEADEIRP